MARLALALLIATVGIAGCFSGPPKPRDFCYHEVITWEDPGLYERLPGGGKRGAWSIRAESGARGLELDDAALSSEWGEFSLLRVTWRAPNWTAGTQDFWHPSLRLWDSPRIGFMVEGNMEPDRARSMLREFLVNVTYTPAISVDPLLDKILEEPDSHGGDDDLWGWAYSYELKGPFRMKELLADLRQTGTGVREAEFGEVTETYGAWEFVFDVGEKVLERETQDDYLKLWSSASGRLQFDHGGRVPLSKNETRDLLRTVYEDLGVTHVPDLSSSGWGHGGKTPPCDGTPGLTHERDRLQGPSRERAT